LCLLQVGEDRECALCFRCPGVPEVRPGCKECLVGVELIRGKAGIHRHQGEVDSKRAVLCDLPHGPDTKSGSVDGCLLFAGEVLTCPYHLPLGPGIHEHNARYVIRVPGCIIPHVLPAQRMSDKDVGRADVRSTEERMQPPGHIPCSDIPFERVAPPVSLPVIGADPGEICDTRLDLCPGEGDIRCAGFQNNDGAAGSRAPDVHPAAIHLKDFAGRRPGSAQLPYRVGRRRCRGLLRATGGKDQCTEKECHEREGEGEPASFCHPYPHVGLSGIYVLFVLQITAARLRSSGAKLQALPGTHRYRSPRPRAGRAP